MIKIFFYLNQKKNGCFPFFSLSPLFFYMFVEKNDNDKQKLPSVIHNVGG